MAKKRLALLVVLLSGIVALTGAATAQAAPTKPDPKQDKANLEQFWAKAMGANKQSTNPDTTQNLAAGFRMDRLAKAQPDECFYGVGSDNNGPIPASGCPSGSQPKVDQAYVWGLAKAGDNLWFGTAPNVHCLVIGGYLGMTAPIETDSYVCEFGQSKWARSTIAQNPGAAGLVSAIGDWRAPQVFTYNVSTRALTEMTSRVPAGTLSYLRLNSTLGLRSAGSLGNVVFLAGPGMQGGINLFAFNADGTFINSTTFPQFTNIRKWLVVDGVLYVGVAGKDGGGFVLRWTGSAAAPFSFEVVGSVDSDAAELAVHEGRLFVGTWPGGELAGGEALAGLFMSGPIPIGGFHGSAYNPTPGVALPSAPQWTKVWDAGYYEPDPVTAATYGGGALVSFGDYLYWGTMHVPFLAGEANLQYYSSYYGGKPSELQTVAAFLGTHRAISIFRGKNFDSNPEMQLAYGESFLPVFNPASGWTFKPTKMGAPLYGPSGFGNFFNNYTWTMAIYDNRLFVGTMDWSYLAGDMLKSFVNDYTGQPLTVPVEIPKGHYGADLWSFKSPKGAANPISQDGVGNYTNYGIRTILSTAEALYLGMSNPMNLLTNPTDRVPEGGWELIEVTKK